MALRSCTPSNRNAVRFKKYKTVCASSYSQTGTSAGKRPALARRGRPIWAKPDRQAEGQMLPLERNSAQQDGEISLPVPKEDMGRNDSGKKVGQGI